MTAKNLCRILEKHMDDRITVSTGDREQDQHTGILKKTYCDIGKFMIKNSIADESYTIPAKDPDGGILSITCNSCNDKVLYKYRG